MYLHYSNIHVLEFITMFRIDLFLPVIEICNDV